MDPTKVSGGKAAKAAAPKPEKAHKDAKPSKDFSKELAKAAAAKPYKAAKHARPTEDAEAKPRKADKAGAAAKAPSRQPPGPVVEESVYDPGVQILKVKDTEGGRKDQTVRITGSISVVDKQGDAVEGSRAHAGRAKRVRDVTVEVSDSNGTTRKTYRNTELEPHVILGTQVKEVEVRGDFNRTVTIASDTYSGDLKINARKARFEEKTLQTIRLNESQTYTDVRHNALRVDVKGDRQTWAQEKDRGKGDPLRGPEPTRGDVTVLGSPNRDEITVRSGGKVTVDAGAGRDYIEAYGGPGSVVNGGDGGDFIHTGARDGAERWHGTETTEYYGGAGRDSFGIADASRLKQLKDYDSSDLDEVTRD